MLPPRTGENTIAASRQISRCTARSDATIGNPLDMDSSQRMREGFGIGWGDVNVAGTIEMMQRAIGNGSKLHDLDVLNASQAFCQRRSVFGTIRSGIFGRTQPAGEEKLHRPPIQTAADNRERPQ
jgi:hypothetical protein